MKPNLVSGIIVLALAGYLGYNKGFFSYQQKRGEIRQKLAQEQETQQLRVQLASSLEQLEQLRKRLSPEPQADWLIRNITALADQTALNLTSIAPQIPTTTLDFTHIPVVIQFVGSYHKLGEFISRLESADAYMRVDELEVSRGAREEFPANVRMTVSTLYAPPLDGRPAATAQTAQKSAGQSAQARMGAFRGLEDL